MKLTKKAIIEIMYYGDMNEDYFNRGCKCEVIKLSMFREFVKALKERAYPLGHGYGTMIDVEAVDELCGEVLE